MMILPLLLAMQAEPQPAPQIDYSPAPWPEPGRETDIADGYSTDSSAAARKTMAGFADCVAKASADKTSELLQRDFRSASYRSGLTALSRNNEGCARQAGLNGKMRMADLAFAGALAEAMIERQGKPVNALLARAAAAPAAPTYSFTDTVAMCVVRSAPDQVAALFASDVASDTESAAITALSQPAALCARAAEAKKPLSISPAGLRAMLATAAFRSIASLKDV